MKLRRALSIIGIFFLGFIAGVISLNLLNMHLRDTYRDVLMTNLKLEQELRASKTAREGNTLKSLVHRWNVVDISSSDGFQFFQNMNGENKFLYPFAMLVLKQMHNENKKYEGIRTSESIEIGKLALTLEALGMDELATNQWKIAEGLRGRVSMKAIRNLVEDSINFENSQLHIDVENKYLQNP